MPRSVRSFVQQITSRDTKQRLVAVGKLAEYLEEDSVLDEELEDVVGALIQSSSDNNFRVSEGSLRALVVLVSTTEVILSTQAYLDSILPAGFACLADGKQQVRDQAALLLLVGMRISTPQKVYELLEPGLTHKNSRIKEQVVLCLYTALKEFGFSNVPTKKFTPMVISLLEDASTFVREACILCLEEVYKNVGPSLITEIQQRNIRNSVLSVVLERLEQVPLDPAIIAPPPSQNAAVHNQVNLIGNSGTKKHQPGTPMSTSSATSSFSTQPGSASKVKPVATNTNVPTAPKENRVEIPAIRVSSDKQLQKELEEIEYAISLPDNDWEQRIGALRKLIGLAKGGSASNSLFISAISTKLRDLISQQCLDLRSMVVKEACQCVETLALLIGEPFEPLGDFFVETMFRVIGVGNHVIADSGIQGLRGLLNCTRLGKGVGKILEMMASKNPQQRQFAADSAAIILSQYDKYMGSLDRYAEQFEAAIKGCLSDASPAILLREPLLLWILQQERDFRSVNGTLINSGGTSVSKSSTSSVSDSTPSFPQQKQNETYAMKVRSTAQQDPPQDMTTNITVTVMEPQKRAASKPQARQKAGLIADNPETASPATSGKAIEAKLSDEDTSIETSVADSSVGNISEMIEQADLAQWSCRHSAFVQIRDALESPVAVSSLAREGSRVEALISCCERHLDDPHQKVFVSVLEALDMSIKKSKHKANLYLSHLIPVLFLKLVTTSDKMRPVVSQVLKSIQLNCSPECVFSTVTEFLQHTSSEEQVASEQTQKLVLAVVEFFLDMFSVKFFSEPKTLQILLPIFVGLTEDFSGDVQKASSIAIQELYTRYTNSFLTTTKFLPESCLSSLRKVVISIDPSFDQKVAISRTPQRSQRQDTSLKPNLEKSIFEGFVLPRNLPKEVAAVIEQLSQGGTACKESLCLITLKLTSSTPEEDWVSNLDSLLYGILTTAQSVETLPRQLSLLVLRELLAFHPVLSGKPQTVKSILDLSLRASNDNDPQICAAAHQVLDEIVKSGDKSQLAEATLQIMNASGDEPVVDAAALQVLRMVLRDISLPTWRSQPVWQDVNTTLIKNVNHNALIVRKESAYCLAQLIQGLGEGILPSNAISPSHMILVKKCMDNLTSTSF
ncbi:CLIP-associated protein [Pelomyxa schiedti]|nr:CLIP-associated protein [Pelomyxa schiedti]